LVLRSGLKELVDNSLCASQTDEEYDLEKQMKVYRGPDSKPYSDDTHEHVSTVSGQVLHKGLAMRAPIKVNISKDARERQAVCHLLFEEEDFVPLIEALLVRMKDHQKTLRQMRTAIQSKASLEDKNL
jgi:hypothetical protein